MARNLQQMCYEMESGLNVLRSLKLKYPNSKAFHDFLIHKERDYLEFLRLVSPLRVDTFAPDVVHYLKEQRVETKYLGMTQKTSDYFKVTKKLMKAIEAGK